MLFALSVSRLYWGPYDGALAIVQGAIFYRLLGTLVFWYLTLCLELFVFLFLLFQVQALDHHHGHTIIMILTIAPPPRIVLPISWSLRLTRLALRVSSIHQNQTRAFNLPLFGNLWQPFHKDMNWNSIESMLLAQAYLPCVKGYGKVSWSPFGSICSPYICAKSLDWSLHICIEWKCGRTISTKRC
jgi:hypothetical protein